MNRFRMVHNMTPFPLLINPAIVCCTWVKLRKNQGLLIKKPQYHGYPREKRLKSTWCDNRKLAWKRWLLISEVLVMWPRPIWSISLNIVALKGILVVHASLLQDKSEKSREDLQDKTSPATDIKSYLGLKAPKPRFYVSSTGMYISNAIKWWRHNSQNRSSSGLHHLRKRQQGLRLALGNNFKVLGLSFKVIWI